jgi:hypothetical protein
VFIFSGLCLRFLAKAEVATRFTFHVRASPHQFDIAIEANRHRVIAAAMDKRADVRQPQFLIERGITASRHVEVEAILRPLDYLDVHTSAGGPYIFGDTLEASEVGPKTLRPLLSFFAGKTPNCGQDEIAGSRFAEPFPAGFDEGDQDSAFDPAPL